MHPAGVVIFDLSLVSLLGKDARSERVVRIVEFRIINPHDQESKGDQEDNANDSRYNRVVIAPT